MITIRQATRDDRAAIFAFIRKAYAGRWEFKIPHRWAWQYQDNPFLSGDQLPIWIAVDDKGTVVGQTCAMVEPLQIGDQKTQVGWSVDTYLLPEYRGQGLGFRLQEVNDQANPIFMSLSMSAANRRIKAALGSVSLPPVILFDRPARYPRSNVLTALTERVTTRPGWLRPVARATFQALGADRVAAWAMNRRLAQLDADRLQGTGWPEIRPIAAFDDQADQLWEQIAPQFDALVRRDQVYLNWKYVRQPHMEHLKFMARRNGQLCGYLILRLGQPPEPRVGLLVDLFASPQDTATLDALVAFAVSTLKGHRVDFLTAATSVPAYQEALLRMGFRKRKDITPMIHCRVPGEICHQALEGNWLLGKGDHDWNQFPNG